MIRYSVYRNGEGYWDSTPGKALVHIIIQDQEKRKAELEKMKAAEQARLAQIRREESLQIIKELDQNQKWKLAWTNPCCRLPDFKSGRKG